MVLQWIVIYICMNREYKTVLKDSDLKQLLSKCSYYQEQGR